MEELTGEEFDQFLSSFKNNQRYYNTLEIISYSNENKPLTPNIDFKMYCLDHIKDDTKSFAGMLPKSMDAIFYKKEDNILYLIEFKGSNLNDHGLNKVQNVFDKVVSKNNSITIKSHNKGSNKKDYDCYDKDMEDDLKYVKDHFKDTIQEDSEKKPIESLFMTIPLIYQDYCLRNGKDCKDIRNFLDNCIKKLYLVVAIIEDDENVNEEQSQRKGMNVSHLFYSKKSNKSKSNRRGKFNKSNSTSIKNRRDPIRGYYKKLTVLGIFDDCQIGEKNKFKQFLADEGLEDNN